MNRCLSDADIQALIDGELAPDRAGHLAECAGCANRTDARRRAIEPLLSLTRQAGVPPARLDAMRTRALNRGGGTTLRPARASRTPWLLAVGAAAAAALVFFVALPAVDRQTAVSAAEILGRSQTALATPVSGIESLTYELAVDGVLGDLLPDEQTGRLTVRETIDHDRPGRFRLIKVASDGTIVGGIADDPSTGSRVRYIRANGRGFLLRFSTGDAAAFSFPAMRRVALQAFITLMQTSRDNAVSEIHRDGEACYLVETTEEGAGVGAFLRLERSRAIVTARDARIVEFSASGSVAGRPFSIDFVLRSRAVRPPGAVNENEFVIPSQPGDVILEGNGSANPAWDVVTRALAEIHAGGK
ncbi:MAG: hypothetical protein A3H96_08795 [Acidobacteria bacterium RIFCSPLOWO2_02_FULL_67_36]|nr:MAG: hypothetical protein A3H96_08795 [Acidobacteria bacterium RIFCSPLOWO2_02_FULL_67_36]OFW21066.1 MAG: hypothetical protein A3G21_14185 [Acidobacteria bacterium RIFCSPLOWO2_12_FULL_66_21]